MKKPIPLVIQLFKIQQSTAFLCKDLNRIDIDNNTSELKNKMKILWKMKQDVKINKEKKYQITI